MKGAQEMIKTIHMVAGKIRGQAAQALYLEAEIEMTEAKRRTPVSPTPAPPGVVPGTLRASGQVSEPEINGNRISVTLSFGGPGSGAEDYAVAQHEHLDYFHTTGQAKYLESVLNESQPFMGARVARRMGFNKL